MKNIDITKIIAAAAAGYTSSLVTDWATRRGFERWAVVLLASMAGLLASTAIRLT